MVLRLLGGWSPFQAGKVTGICHTTDIYLNFFMALLSYPLGPQTIKAYHGTVNLTP
jgi:hypothetical protein